MFIGLFWLLTERPLIGRHFIGMRPCNVGIFAVGCPWGRTEEGTLLHSVRLFPHLHLRAHLLTRSQWQRHTQTQTHTHTTIMLLISLELQIEINQTWQAAFIAARSIAAAGTVCCSINSSCRFFFLFLLMMQLLSFFFLPFFSNSNCRRRCFTAVTINLAINCICLVWVESLQWSNYPFFSFSLCAFLSVFRLLFFSFTFKW